MKVYETADIRNLAIVGHGDSGKTSLAEALLFGGGAIKALGNVTENNTVTDFEESEHERQTSMALGVASVEFGGSKINLLDAPGHTSFIGDAPAAMRGAECVVIVVHAVNGIEFQTEKMWDDAAKLGKPVMFVVTQLDRERANFDDVMGALQSRFGRQVLPVTVPIGASENLEGAVRLVNGTAYRVSGAAAEAQAGEAPADMADSIKGWQEQLYDMVAESDESLMEAFMSQGELTPDQMSKGLRVAVSERGIFPVFAASATTMAGVVPLLKSIDDFSPSPLDVVGLKTTDAEGNETVIEPKSDGPALAQVIKTYIDPFAGRISVLKILSGTFQSDASAWNATTDGSEKLSNMSTMLGKPSEKIASARAGDIVSVTKLKNTYTGDSIVSDKSTDLLAPAIPFSKPVLAYAVKAEGDDDKVGIGLTRLAEEDASIALTRDPRTKELMIAGNGQGHLRAVLEKLKKRFSVTATLEKPKIPYLETITKKAQDSYRHKKQSGGAGQFAEVHMRIEPLERGAGFEYASEIFGGSISRNFWPSIEKGVKQIMVDGCIAGYPMVDIKAVIYDGKEHPVDSKDVAFQVAGRNVFKSCVSSAGPVVLEPVMTVVVTCPDENMGDILGDLNKRRGRVAGSDAESGRAVIRATVPMAEMLEYTSTLRALTAGRGSYTMELDHYERVPAEIQQQLVSEYSPQESDD